MTLNLSIGAFAVKTIYRRGFAVPLPPPPQKNTRLGHGDAIHLSDIDPDRPGLEVFDIHEHVRHAVGAEFRDARTGELIWGKPSPDVGRGVALDIDPRHRGYEMWASGPGLTGLWNVKGDTIADRKPRSCNFGVWWDGDLLRELLDRTTISKWNWQEQSERTLLAASGAHPTIRPRRPPVSARTSLVTGGKRSSGERPIVASCGSIPQRSQPSIVCIRSCMTRPTESARPCKMSVTTSRPSPGFISAMA